MVNSAVNLAQAMIQSVLAETDSGVVRSRAINRLARDYRELPWVEGSTYTVPA